MNYKLIPPTEDFFSHQWYERSGPEDLYFMTRIDSTRRKLNALESKLQRLDSERYIPDGRSFLDRVEWLRSYIGIWESRNDGIGQCYVREIYPNTGNIMPVWNERIFGERKEGNVLILLSPSVITWLNVVDKWVSEYTVASSTL